MPPSRNTILSTYCRRSDLNAKIMHCIEITSTITRFISTFLQALNQEPHKRKKRATHQSCTLLLAILYVFTYRNHLTSSKSIRYIYQRLAWTCCKYHANPKISIHKQPQLHVAKVRFFAENNERKTIKYQY